MSIIAETAPNQPFRRDRKEDQTIALARLTIFFLESTITKAEKSFSCSLDVPSGIPASRAARCEAATACRPEAAAAAEVVVTKRGAEMLRYRGRLDKGLQHNTQSPGGPNA